MNLSSPKSINLAGAAAKAEHAARYPGVAMRTVQGLPNAARNALNPAKAMLGAGAGAAGRALQNKAQGAISGLKKKFGGMVATTPKMIKK